MNRRSFFATVLALLFGKPERVLFGTGRRQKRLRIVRQHGPTNWYFDSTLPVDSKCIAVFRDRLILAGGETRVHWSFWRAGARRLG